MSGVSGAGRKVELEYLFGECHESARAYGIPQHRHLSEIEEQLGLAAGQPVVIQFSPHLIPIHRGIATTLYLDPAKPCRSESDAASFGEEIAASYQISLRNRAVCPSVGRKSAARHQERSPGAM